MCRKCTPEHLHCRLFAFWDVGTENYFPSVSETARNPRSRIESSEAEGKYFLVPTDLLPIYFIKIMYFTVRFTIRTLLK